MWKVSKSSLQRFLDLPLGRIPLSCIHLVVISVARPIHYNFALLLPTSILLFCLESSSFDNDLPYVQQVTHFQPGSFIFRTIEIKGLEFFSLSAQAFINLLPAKREHHYFQNIVVTHYFQNIVVTLYMVFLPHFK